MSSILYVGLDTKNNTVTLQGRGMDGVYPSNGYLTAAGNLSTSAYVDISLPGSVKLETEIFYKDIKDINTLASISGANGAAVAALLNSDYFDATASINGFDDVNYDDTSVNNNYVLRWNTDHFTAAQLTPTNVGALADTAGIDDLADTDTGSATDGQVLTWFHGDGEWRPANIPSVDVAMNDLTDVDTVGLAVGDGLKWNGGDFVAGKWGVGDGNQVIPANSTTSGGTVRTITLETETNFPTTFTSTSSLDLVDSNGNLLESVRMLEIDTTGTPVYLATQNKYGVLTNKKDAGGADAKIGFNNQYADGGNNMYLKCTSITSAYEVNFPSSGSTTEGQVLSVASSSAGTDTDLEWTTPRQLRMYENAGLHLLSTSTDTRYRWCTSTSYPNYGNWSKSTTSTPTAVTTDFSQYWRKGGHKIAVSTADANITFKGYASISTSSTSNINATEYASTDYVWYMYRVSPTTGNSCTVTQIGTDTITFDGTHTGYPQDIDITVTGQTLDAGDVVALVGKGAVNATANRYLMLDYTMEISY